MKTNTKTMSNKLEQIRTLLGLTPTKLAEATLVDGTVIGTDAEAFEDGALVFITGDDGERMPLPTGDYELADGTMVSVVDGEIQSKKEEEGADEDLKKDGKKEEEEMTSEIDLSAYALKSELVESLELMMAKIEELETKLSSVDVVAEELSSLKKLSADKPFKHTMSVRDKIAEKKAISQMTSKERVYEIFNKIKNN